MNSSTDSHLVLDPNSLRTDLSEIPHDIRTLELTFGGGHWAGRHQICSLKATMPRTVAEVVVNLSDCHDASDLTAHGLRQRDNMWYIIAGEIAALTFTRPDLKWRIVLTERIPFGLCLLNRNFHLAPNSDPHADVERRLLEDLASRRIVLRNVSIVRGWR
jgi:hypothetical protein